MVRRIEVSLRPEFQDAAADRIFSLLKSDHGLSDIESVRRANVYTFEDDLSEADAHKLASELLADPVNQEFSIGRVIDSHFDFAIEAGFRPGVKDNVGETARAGAGDVLGRPLAGEVFTSTLYLIQGEFPRAKAKAVAEGLMCNPLIHRWAAFEPGQVHEYYSSLTLPKAGVTHKGTVLEIPLPSDEHELARLSRQRLLALNVAEMQAIAEHYQEAKFRQAREKVGLGIHPTDVELEALAQTWSEHCKHKIFNATIEYTDHRPPQEPLGPADVDLRTVAHASSPQKPAKKAAPKKQVIKSLFKTYIASTTQGVHSAQKYLLSVFTDNAGIMALDEHWALAMKVETHNTPSALDPYGGALTGILGVNRDILGTGMGAKPIFNTDVFCFADPFYSGTLPPRLLHPRRVFEGVRAGVERGGNASGIPTVNGAIVFDDRYLGKPLVYCGTGGLMPRKAAGLKTSEKYVKPGDRIFVVGGRVGKDGIHGATFSSEGLHEGSPTSAVQLGDPITQKGVLDFLLESRDRGLHTGLTDNGAGGISSSIGEMAQMTGGAHIHLDRCPLKYPGLDPWEILVSESQERMTVAVSPAKAGDFAALAAHHGVEATDLGEFTKDGFLRADYYNYTVALLDLHFLHGGCPKLQLKAEWTPAAHAEPDLPEPEDLGASLLNLMARPNICSKESIIRQYDHEVQGMSVVKPLCGAAASGPSDAAVVQPLPDKRLGVVVSNGLCPRYSDIDPYWMAVAAVDEAVRNYVATGGDPAHWGALDNFCWPDPVAGPHNPDGERKLAALVRANQGLADACTAYKLPLISGKDSMKNDYAHGNVRISVPPTLLVSLVGVIPDVEHAVTTDFKRAGDLIYVLGATRPELGASEYYASFGEVGTAVPRADLAANHSLYSKLHKAIRAGLVSSAHDCSDGGLGVALAECCIGGRLGARVRLASAPGCERLRASHALFSESTGRFVVSVRPRDAGRFEEALKGSAFARVGEVVAEGRLRIEAAGSSKELDVAVDELEKQFKRTITW